MSKALVFILVGLLAATLITARNVDKKAPACRGHGYDCVSASQCCPGMRCNAYAHRCQVIITEEELMAQREKILGRKGKDY